MARIKKPAIRRYRVASPHITQSIRCLLLSDLHDSDYGEKQYVLVNMLREQCPDVVLMAGDMADCLRSHERTGQLMAAVACRYPCCYVSGNHELRTGEADRLKEWFRSFGVVVLQGQAMLLSVRGQRLCVGGLDDRRIGEKEWDRQLESCREQRNADCFSLLLSHRPDLIQAYRSSGYELICCGHAHGGQIRIPGLINGLYAPHQGFFPRYAGGLYDLGSCFMAVSRGLAKNGLPRFGNPPELVVIEVTPPEIGE